MYTFLALPTLAFFLVLSPHAIILIFSVPKSLYSNIMKKRKIRLVTMATPMSSHVKDKNSIFTARDEDMIF